MSEKSLAPQGGYDMMNKGAQHDEAWLIFTDVWPPGMTVQDVLDALKSGFRMIAVKVNGQPMPRRDFASQRRRVGPRCWRCT